MLCISNAALLAECVVHPCISLQMGHRSESLPVTQGSMACRTSAPVLPTICPTRCSCSCSVKCSAKSGHTCTNNLLLKPTGIPEKGCRYGDSTYRVLTQAPHPPMSHQPFTARAGLFTSCSSARTCCSMDARVAAVSRCSVAACLRASRGPWLPLIAFIACRGGRDSKQALTVTQSCHTTPTLLSTGMQATRHPLGTPSACSLYQATHGCRCVDHGC